MDWTQFHKLAICLLDWLLYNEFDECSKSLISYLEHTSRAPFFPNNNKDLCLRLLNYRHKREIDKNKQLVLQTQAKGIFDELQIAANADSDVFCCLSKIDYPFLSKMVSLGPSTFDSVMLKADVNSLFNCLYKCTTHLEIGDTKTATSFAHEACSILLTKLSSNEHLRKSNNDGKNSTNFRRLITKIKAKRQIPNVQCEGRRNSSVNEMIGRESVALSTQRTINTSQCLFSQSQTDLESTSEEELAILTHHTSDRYSPTVFEKNMNARQAGTSQPIGLKRGSPNLTKYSPKKSPKKSSKNTIYSAVATICPPRKLL